MDSTRLLVKMWSWNIQNPFSKRYIPFNFNVSLLKGHPNVKVIHSSIAVGEPPFFMASSVFFAIKDVILAARAETGHTRWFPLDNPATPERIRMACLDEFTAPPQA
ncbi:hypothetical protein F3Y22_tig00004502pilonHSYRG00006 [Hibiscus syriacus]|uniref:Aldehyde oxidase/xanthine dehydrogenase second molybdopterin binding domain-containing protein n=1 Tax=Hibiscus syriacus TaxID=106335 RepID=A0A6A3CIM6_HIBSY|nr:hypothetical protein F3Y22_tig00004502pilonHSYRG00006 [Hibiscus syriacus]